jgi:hypothetical protein
MMGINGFPAKWSRLRVPKKIKKPLAKVFQSDSLSAPFDLKVSGQHVCRPITGFHQGNRIDGLANFEVADKNFLLCQLKHLDR